MQSSLDLIGQWAYKLSAAFIVCLPFVVPLSSYRNIEMQSVILLIAGLLSLIALITNKKRNPTGISRNETLLIGIFIVCCIVSFFISPNKNYGFFGAPYIRLGAAELLACIACAFMLKAVSSKQLATWLYRIICALAIISIPYSMVRFNSVSRIGGVFAQADIFAVILGCGFLLGVVHASKKSLDSSKQWFRWILPLFLFGLLLQTQTRAVILVTLTICGYMFWKRRGYNRWSRKQRIGAVTVVLGLVALAIILLPSRVTSPSYASNSINYRLRLQSSALHSSAEKPFLGYGPGNTADALACDKLTAASLQKTCQDGYFFNSSHNIYLDRVLAIGWIGGLAFLILVIIELSKGLRANSYTQTLAYCLLLIASYYLTNVTNIPLELLVWVLLIHIAFHARRNSNST